MKYCLNCKRNVQTTRNINLILQIIIAVVTLGFAIPIQLIWIFLKKSVCPLCGVAAWGAPVAE